jgi:hypothetical protein
MYCRRALRSSTHRKPWVLLASAPVNESVAFITGSDVVVRVRMICVDKAKVPQYLPIALIFSNVPHPCLLSALGRFLLFWGVASISIALQISVPLAIMFCVGLVVRGAGFGAQVPSSLRPKSDRETGAVFQFCNNNMQSLRTLENGVRTSCKASYFHLVRLLL